MEDEKPYDRFGCPFSCLAWLSILAALISVLVFIGGVIAIFRGADSANLLIIVGLVGAVSFGGLAYWFGKQPDNYIRDPDNDDPGYPF